MSKHTDNRRRWTKREARTSDLRGIGLSGFWWWRFAFSAAIREAIVYDPSRVQDGGAVSEPEHSLLEQPQVEKALELSSGHEFEAKLEMQNVVRLVQMFSDVLRGSQRSHRFDPLACTASVACVTRQEMGICLNLRMKA